MTIYQTVWPILWIYERVFFFCWNRRENFKNAILTNFRKTRQTIDGELKQM